jgi:hypothetical protein
MDHGRRRLTLGERDARDYGDCREAADEQIVFMCLPRSLTQREIDAAGPRG